MNRAWLGGVLAIFSLVLSGCAGGPPSKADATTSAPPPSPPTEETGNLRVSVTDEEMVPMPGVDVGLREVDRVAQTDNEGLFVFDKLDPGPYSLYVQRIGYEPVARSVDVLAGETTDESVVLILLEMAVPSVNVTTINGLMGCAGPQGVYPCVLQMEGIDQSLHDGIQVEKNAGGVAYDVYWEPNLGGFPANMEIVVYKGGCDEEIARATGPPPLQLLLPMDNATKDGKPFKTCIEMYAGEMDVAVQQEYEIDVSAFYHQGVPAGYRSRA